MKFLKILPLVCLLSTSMAKETIEFVRIKPGEFTMGEGDGTVKVTITRGFYIGKYEVTQKQWYEVMENNPSFFNTEDHCPEEGEHQVINGIPMCSNYPVETVSVNDIEVFIQTSNERRGLLNCKGEYNDPSGCLRLPTEAEWEYATRADSETEFFWGDNHKLQFDMVGLLIIQGAKPKKWELENPTVGGFTTPRGMFLSQFKIDGILHCWKALTQCDEKVRYCGFFGGGCWGDYPPHLDSAYRIFEHPRVPSEYAGFRLVRNI